MPFKRCNNCRKAITQKVKRSPGENTGCQVELVWNRVSLHDVLWCIFTHLVRFRHLDEHVLGVRVLVLVWMPREAKQDIVNHHHGHAGLSVLSDQRLVGRLVGYQAPIQVLNLPCKLSRGLIGSSQDVLALHRRPGVKSLTIPWRGSCTPFSLPPDSHSCWHPGFCRGHIQMRLSPTAHSKLEEIWRAEVSEGIGGFSEASSLGLSSSTANVS